MEHYTIIGREIVLSFTPTRDSKEGLVLRRKITRSWERKHGKSFDPIMTADIKKGENVYLLPQRLQKK